MVGLMLKKAGISLGALSLLLFSAPSHALTNIRCIGNSVTMTSQYPQKLQVLLGTTNYKVYNDGVGGSGITGWSLQYITLNGTAYGRTETNFIDILAAKPQIICIDLGINDTHNPDQSNLRTIFRQGYNKLMDTLLTISPKPKLFLVLPTPQYAPEQQVWIDNNNNVICPIIDSLAKERGFPLIDVHTPLLNHREWYPATDGCHISNTSPGADTIAKIFYRAIVSATANHSDQAVVSNAAGIEIGLIDCGLSVSVPGKTAWTLDLVTLDGTRIARYSGSGSRKTALAEKSGGTRLLIARLQTATGKRTSAIVDLQ